MFIYVYGNLKVEEPVLHPREQGVVQDDRADEHVLRLCVRVLLKDLYLRRRRKDQDALHLVRGDVFLERLVHKVRGLVLRRDHLRLDLVPGQVHVYVVREVFHLAELPLVPSDNSFL